MLHWRSSLADWIIGAWLNLRDVAKALSCHGGCPFVIPPNRPTVPFSIIKMGVPVNGAAGIPALYGPGASKPWVRALRDLAHPRHLLN